jgi:hypothetical protein
MPAARGADIAQELSRRRIEQANVQIILLHGHAAADPAGRRAVVRSFDFDATLEIAVRTYRTTKP